VTNDTIFPDVSEFQPHVDFKALRAATAAVAVRVLYGTRLDKNMPKRRDDVRAAGFTAVIWYTFLRASQTPKEQADALIAVLGDLRPGEAVCIDWETDGGRIPSPAARDAACSLLEQRYNQRTLIYTGAALASGGSVQGRPLWIASYGTLEPGQSHVIWQYTNGTYTSGKYKPVSWPSIGVCDTNVYHGSAEQLAAQIHTNAAPTPPHDYGDDEMAAVFTVEWKNTGHKGVADKTGAYANLGSPFYGNPLALKPENRVNITANSLLGITVVDPDDESKGYIFYNQGPTRTETYVFDAVTWGKIQRGEI
jgi:hypothetical protein